MSRRMVILDVDGVLTDFHDAARHVIRREFGYDFPITRYTEWDVTSVLPTREEKDRMNSLIAAPGFAAALEPIPEAVFAVRELREEGVDILFATAPFAGSPTWKSEREDWLARHFDAPHDEVAHIHRKSFLGGDVFVDDKPSNVRGWSRRNPSGVGFLWRRCYNESEEGLRFATSWDDILRAVLL